jgi:hypothetical protein
MKHDTAMIPGHGLQSYTFVGTLSPVMKVASASVGAVVQII